MILLLSMAFNNRSPQNHKFLITVSKSRFVVNNRMCGMDLLLIGLVSLLAKLEVGKITQPFPNFRVLLESQFAEVPGLFRVLLLLLAGWCATVNHRYNRDLCRGWFTRGCSYLCTCTPPQLDLLTGWLRFFCRYKNTMWMYSISKIYLYSL